MLLMFDTCGDIFGINLSGEIDDKELRELYLFFKYLFLWTTYNIGFAAIQVSHLSVIPTSSANDNTKGLLVTYRTSFTFISGITVMIISEIITV